MNASFDNDGGRAVRALLTGTGAFAQVAPNPNNPNDVVPEASNPPPYGDSINIETAKKVAAAAIAESKVRAAG
jgi:glc operon protein GlcG